MNGQTITTNCAFSFSSTFGVYVASAVFATIVKPDMIKVVALRRCQSFEGAPCGPAACSREEEKRGLV